MGMEWPLDYKGELGRRQRIWLAGLHSEAVAGAAKLLYASDPSIFVNDCVFVYEPRNASQKLPTKIPTVPFPRQADFLRWLKTMYEIKESGPVEKSRDSGATWMAAAFAVWVWLFFPGAVVGFGSRKEQLVDRLGDMNAIFPKIRVIIDNLPPWLMPKGYDPRKHSSYMRIVNPENEAVIIGEAGDNIGRGGRSSIYFVDESAFLERPEMIDAALTANTDVRIDISSPRVGTVFDTWCSTAKTVTIETPEGPKTIPTKFIFDVHDAPWHTREWIAKKQSELEGKGLGHIFRREYLRDATAGISGQLINSMWIEAAVGAAQKLGIKPTGKRTAALDVADGGRDRNSLAMRHGIELFYQVSRPDLLADGAGNWSYFEAMNADCSSLRYESTGVGAGAAAALRGKKILKVSGWSPSGGVVTPTKKYEGNRTHEDMFANARAQAWWLLRDRFIKTYQLVAEGKLGINPDDIISLDPDLPELRELKSELAQVVYEHNNAGKVLIDKQPDDKPSPNRADSVMIAYAPEKPGVTSLGEY